MMDTFASVIAGSAKYSAKGGASFKTWLYAVAKKSAFLFLRKNHITESIEADADTPADELEIPENVLLKDEKNRELYEAINRLSPDQRTVLYLKYFEDMDPGAISRVMKKSIRQVYKLTEKGKIRLRQLITYREIL